mmetsp:Transcript_13264/g.50785  ORF Transcript_13264/g.50785 Transcript_13264/m.50785 type:complete len:226 (-) Transcript_13264:209-886(-)
MRPLPSRRHSAGCNSCAVRELGHEVRRCRRCREPGQHIAIDRAVVQLRCGRRRVERCLACERARQALPLSCLRVQLGQVGGQAGEVAAVLVVPRVDNRLAPRRQLVELLLSTGKELSHPLGEVLRRARGHLGNELKLRANASPPNRRGIPTRGFFGQVAQPRDRSQLAARRQGSPADALGVGRHDWLVIALLVAAAVFVAAPAGSASRCAAAGVPAALALGAFGA